MTTERFARLLKGALHHPLPMFIITRVSLALMAVVTICGKEGADALEAFCESPKPEAREADGRLSDERFNELLNGPLSAEDVPSTISQKVAALKYVVDTCGKKGDLALESWCEQREAQDRMHDGLTAKRDPILCQWISGVVKNKPVESGSFLKAVANAALRADWENYPILWPALLDLKTKYPKFHDPEAEPECW